MNLSENSIKQSTIGFLGIKCKCTEETFAIDGTKNPSNHDIPAIATLETSVDAQIVIAYKQYDVSNPMPRTNHIIIKDLTPRPDLAVRNNANMPIKSTLNNINSANCKFFNMYGNKEYKIGEHIVSEIFDPKSSNPGGEGIRFDLDVRNTKHRLKKINW
ncbi:MAG: hypothetical protein Satyrvirus44_6 [Satyrvirus sp.]|uniref:Uncharacterized protein n=1 Tax=Satyrvirus sp. TaxID=2487771 RepID=A0A3G5AHN5_9VIRU|nr:MAG: hypothetical protein Satyrvirus44_6 [Satyrvirus sp.]